MRWNVFCSMIGTEDENCFRCNSLPLDEPNCEIFCMNFSAQHFIYFKICVYNSKSLVIYCLYQLHLYYLFLLCPSFYCMSDFILAILFLEIICFLEQCYFPPEMVYMYFHQKAITPGQDQLQLRIWDNLNLNYRHWVAYSHLYLP